VTKVAEYRDLAVEDLRHRERDLTDQMFRLRIQKAMGQLDRPGKLRSLRRDLARVKISLRQKTAAARPGGTA
jgi:large subunit ribosomal protein L29